MMTTLMEEAIAALRQDVPTKNQDDLARIIMQLIGKVDPVYQLTREETADLDEADADIARGELATDDQVRAIWAKHGLSESTIRRRHCGNSMKF